MLSFTTEVHRMRVVVGTLLLSLSLVSIGAGQASGQQPATQLPAEADPGVRPFRLIDRDEIRVARVEVQPGAVRHGFRNTGTTPAAVFEIFVKKSTTTAAVGADLDVKRLLAGLGVSAGR